MPLLSDQDRQIVQETAGRDQPSGHAALLHPDHRRSGHRPHREADPRRSRHAERLTSRSRKSTSCSTRIAPRSTASSDIPAIVLLRSGEDTRIRFLGAPAGYEFMSLVDAIILAGHERFRTVADKPAADRRSRARAAGISVFVTPTCPHCPRAVTLAHRMAVESPHIRATLRRGHRVHRPVATVSGDRRPEDRSQWHDRDPRRPARGRLHPADRRSARHCSGDCSGR